MNKRILIKQHTRKNGQMVKSHKRQKQSSTFEKGYRKAIREVFCEFEEIDKKEKRNYWRWNLLGSFIREKVERQFKEVSITRFREDKN